MNSKIKDRSFSKILSDFSLIILLAVLFIFFSLISKDFLTPVNLTNILVQNVHVAVVAAATLIIMVSGGVDLSIGYQVSVASVIVTKFISEGTLPLWAALIVGILVCMVLGTFNGFIALKLKAHTMIVTLGTMAIFQGISYLISNSKTFYKLPFEFMYIGQGRLFGWLPLNAIIMVVLVIIVGIVMEKTYIGRNIYSAGDNPEAARLAGLRVNRIKVLAFTAGGVLVGIAAILLASRAGSADSTTGLGLEFNGITACVLGGVALKGGEGKLWRVFIAVFILGVLGNGMQMISLGSYPQYIAKGLIMLISIYLSNRSQPKTI